MFYINPKHYNANHSLGTIMFELEDKNKAIQYFEAALKIDQNSIRTNYSVALVYQKFASDEKDKDKVNKKTRFDIKEWKPIALWS